VLITVKPKTASEKGNGESLVNLTRFAELWGETVPAVIEDAKSSGASRVASTILTGRNTCAAISAAYVFLLLAGF